MEITENSKTLKFDANGLIPAIVQDHYTKEVLTLAYMNAETLALTIAEGRTVFWSRSRREIWRKGETSGNVQRVVSITADCDKDALVIDVKLRDGTVTYQTSVDGGQYVTVGDESSLENLRTLLQSDRWTVARISALADHAYAKARRDETALRREDGGLWYDCDSMCWLDPNKPETQQYLADLCAECASLGFDEILLDQFTYPTVGRLDRLQTGDVEKTAVLAALTVRLREAIPKPTALSIELHSDPVADTDKSGLTLELVTGSFDRIYLDTADLPLATLQGELPADYDQTVRFVPLVKQAAASGSYLQTN